MLEYSVMLEMLPSPKNSLCFWCFNIVDECRWQNKHFDVTILFLWPSKRQKKCCVSTHPGLPYLIQRATNMLWTLESEISSSIMNKHKLLFLYSCHHHVCLSLTWTCKYIFSKCLNIMHISYDPKQVIRFGGEIKELSLLQWLQTASHLPRNGTFFRQLLFRVFISHSKIKVDKSSHFSKACILSSKWHTYSC